MQRLRITVTKNSSDRSDDLIVISKLRRDLYAHSAVEIDPDSPTYATHRDDQGRAYFEITTDYRDEVERIVTKFGYSDRATISEGTGLVGEPCLNCGNVTGGEQPAVCPTCGFRDIAPCPYCRQDIPRTAYLDAEGQLKRCPKCNQRVRLRLSDPLFDADGYYTQPVVIVEKPL